MQNESIPGFPGPPLQHYNVLPDVNAPFASSVAGGPPRVPSVVEAYSNFAGAISQLALFKDQNFKLRSALNQLYNLFQTEQRRFAEKYRQLQDAKDVSEKRAKMDVDRLKTEVTKLQDHLAKVMLELMELKADKQKLEGQMARPPRPPSIVVPAALMEQALAPSAKLSANTTPITSPHNADSDPSIDIATENSGQEESPLQYSDKLDAPVVAFMRSMLNESLGEAEEQSCMPPPLPVEDFAGQSPYALNLKSLYLCFTDRTWQGQLVHAHRAREYLRDVVDMMSVDTLKRHLHSEGPMQCKLCNQFFNDFLAYVVHLVLPMHVLRSDIAQACLLKATLRREYPLSPQELQDVCKRLLDIVSIRWVGYDCVACDKHCEDVKSYAEHCRTQQHIMSMAALINELCEAEQADGDAGSAAFLRCILDSSLLLLKACEISHCIYHLRKEMTVGAGSQVHDRTLDQLNADYTKICREYDAACFDIFASPKTFDPSKYSPRVPRAEASRLLALKPPRCRRGKRGKASGMRIADDFTEERRRRLGLPAPAAANQLPPEILALSGPMGELLKSQMLAKGGVLSGGEGMSLPSLHSMPGMDLHAAYNLPPPGSLAFRERDMLMPGAFPPSQMHHGPPGPPPPPPPPSHMHPPPPSSAQNAQLINSMLQSMAAAMLPRSMSGSCHDSTCSCSEDGSEPPFAPPPHLRSASFTRAMDGAMLPPQPPPRSYSAPLRDRDISPMPPRHGSWPMPHAGSMAAPRPPPMGSWPSCTVLVEDRDDVRPPPCPPPPPPAPPAPSAPPPLLLPSQDGDEPGRHAPAPPRAPTSPMRRLLDQVAARSPRISPRSLASGKDASPRALLARKSGLTPRRANDIRLGDDQGKRGRGGRDQGFGDQLSFEDEDAFLRRLGWSAEEDGEHWGLTMEEMAGFSNTDDA